MSLEQDLLRRIEDLVNRRAVTDRRMGNIWMLVPLLPIVVVIALVAAFVQAIAPMLSNLQALQENVAANSIVVQLLGLYASAIVSIYLLFFLLSLALYFLIDRRNNHFKRQQLLSQTLVKYLETRTKAVSPRPSKLAELCDELTYEEQDRPAGIWAILNLFVTPIVSLVVAFNLTQDLGKHDVRQINFQENLAATFTEIGVTPPSLASQKPLKRDTILFLLLTFITAGFFWICWFYTLLKDYNEHFANQALFEDRMLAALKPTPHGRNCGSCGGSVPETAKYCPFCGTLQTS